MTRADLLIRGGTVITMDGQRRILEDASVAVADATIVGVGPSAQVSAAFEAVETIDARGHIVTPGLTNAHVHLTGPSLFPGAEPGESPIAEHFPRWVIPPHAAADPEAERAAARLVAVGMLQEGTTSFIEAGVCRFPDAVVDGLQDLGIRGALSIWSSDRWPVPGEDPRSTAQVIERMRASLEDAEGLIEVWPSVSGHDACSDELYLAAASLAREHGVNWTFHMSAMDMDRTHFRAEHGADPLVHLDRLDVLDERAVIAHAIYLTDAEIEVLERTGAGVAYCPGASLRLCTGVSRVGRHSQLRHVALGTDTANASNHLDLLRSAGLACDLYGEIDGDRSRLTAPRALEWLTLGGARALGRAGRIGALQPGHRADIAVFDPRQPVWNAANALVHGAPRARDVIVDGRVVMRAGVVPGAGAIHDEAMDHARRLSFSLP